MARVGLRADPVVVPPSALRPYLGFAKLSATALAAIARVVDQDDEFRARVAAAVDAEAVGRGGWLWLTRPPGWADELAAIEAAESERHASRAAERQAAREERSAARRLAATQAALSRAEALAEERRLELDRLQRELEGARAERADAEARLARLEANLAELTEGRAAAVRNLKDAEARLVRRATEVNALKARVRELEAGAVERDDVVASGDPAPAAPEPGGDERAAATFEVDRGALARELGRAAEGAASLADGLAGLAAALGGPEGAGAGAVAPRARDGPPDLPPPREPSDSAPASGPEPAPAGSRGPSGSRGTRAVATAGDAAGPGARTPVALPGGVLDDSIGAAEHLLRTPGAVLVVDGYNVTMTGWPGLPPSEQRRRLVAALADLAARTSTRVELVFDGADVGDAGDGRLTVPAPARQLVRVRFSPPGVEADDVVIDLVAQLPVTRPVVVASSDNRVRQGARARGANLLYSRQLLDTLGVGTS